MGEGGLAEPGIKSCVKDSGFCQEHWEVIESF